MEHVSCSSWNRFGWESRGAESPVLRHARADVSARSLTRSVLGVGGTQHPARLRTGPAARARRLRCRVGYARPRPPRESRGTRACG